MEEIGLLGGVKARVLNILKSHLMDITIPILLLANHSMKIPPETPKMGRALLLTNRVCDALLSLAEIRESLYGVNSKEDDIEMLTHQRGNCTIL